MQDWKERHAHHTTWVKRNALGSFLRSIGQGQLARSLPRVKKPAARTVIATQAETNRLIAAAPPWLRLWMLLCATLGLRFNEARLARTADWNREQHTLQIIEKGGTSRLVPVSPEIEKLLELVPTTQQQGPAVEALRGTRPLLEGRLRAAWLKLKQTCAVNPELHPHDMRRTLATQLYRSTKDIRAVQQLLGHRNLASTAHYLAPHDMAEMSRLLAELRPPTQVKQ